MSNDSSKHVIDVMVTVYYVGEGGNSPSGQYLFRFSQDVVHVTARNTLIRYNLSDDSFERGIRFDGYFVSDSHRQVIKAPDTNDLVATGRMIALIHRNDTESLLLNISLHVKEIGVPGRRGGLDPQITNVPSPH